MTAVFDSNVWVSALRFGGKPLLALDTAYLRHTFGTCPEIEEEVTRNLHSKFGIKPQTTLTIINRYLEDARRVFPTGKLRNVCRDRSDDIIIECAILSSADMIVTGDKDLLALRSYGEIQIVSPADAIEIMTALKK